MLAVEGRIVRSLQMFIYRIGISAMGTDGEEQSLSGEALKPAVGTRREG